MRHEHDNANRHAYNTLAEANRRLDSGKVRNPREHAMLMAMIKDATDITRNHNATNDARPYSETNIGYNADMRQRRSTYDNMDDAMDYVMDAISRILPHVVDNYDTDVDMRQGVPGTGPYANPRLRRRGGRKGIGRRRYEMDDRYNDDDRYDTDDRYDYDDRYDADDIEARRGGARRRDSRGRFTRSDYDRYNDVDDIRRTADEARRTADVAVNIAQRMADTSPVMMRSKYSDARNDTNYARTDDDITTDRAHRPGPDMRR